MTEVFEAELPYLLFKNQKSKHITWGCDTVHLFDSQRIPLRSLDPRPPKPWLMYGVHDISELVLRDLWYIVWRPLPEKMPSLCPRIPERQTPEATCSSVLGPSHDQSPWFPWSPEFSPALLQSHPLAIKPGHEHMHLISYNIYGQLRYHWLWRLLALCQFERILGYFEGLIKR